MEALYNYIDDLLRLQSDAVQKHNHNGVLGGIREDFIHAEVSLRIDNIKDRLHRGEVYSKTDEFGQHDVILRRKNAINPIIGGAVRIDVKDCAAIIEVKSNSTLTEISDFDEKSRLLKKANPNLVCGMFCYRIRGKTKTVLERSGYRFDREYQSFDLCDGKRIYKNMDFLMCLDEDIEINGKDRNRDEIQYSKSFFIKKDGADYTLFNQGPFSKYLLVEIQRADSQ